MSKSIAIMQPTYLPWLGYLALIERVDAFVFLDSVQFDRRSWQQRNRIKSAQGVQWLSVPVHKKGRRDQRIDEVEVIYDEHFPHKHTLSLRHAYARAPYYPEYAPAMAARLEQAPPLLADLTIGLTEWLCSCLHIATPVYRSSQLANATGAKADLLASICVELGATTYVSPPGSADYLDASDALPQHGIELVYHTYNHPVYNQLHGDFVSHLSAIDLLFNHGPDSRAIMLAGLAPAGDQP